MCCKVDILEAVVQARIQTSNGGKSEAANEAATAASTPALAPVGSQCAHVPTRQREIAHEVNTMYRCEEHHVQIS